MMQGCFTKHIAQVIGCGDVVSIRKVEFCYDGGTTQL